MSEPHVLHWNGKDLPAELRQMRPGSYLIEPMESGMLSLSPEEDAAVQAGLDEIDRGDTLLARDVFKQLDETLRKR